jgi:hypothetical protein
MVTFALFVKFQIANKEPHWKFSAFTDSISDVQEFIKNVLLDVIKTKDDSYKTIDFKVVTLF